MIFGFRGAARRCVILLAVDNIPGVLRTSGCGGQLCGTAVHHRLDKQVLLSFTHQLASLRCSLTTKEHKINLLFSEP